MNYGGFYNEVVVLATGGTIAGGSADKSAVTGYTFALTNGGLK